MTEPNAPNSQQQPKGEGVTIRSLAPAKVGVDTTVGSVFVRRPRRTDWPSLEDVPVKDLGLALIKLLANRNEDKSDLSPLSSEDYKQLTKADLQSLAEAISIQNQWGHLSPDAGLRDLGDSAAVALRAEHEQSEKALAKLRKSIDKSYNFLGNTTLERLQKQMASMATIHRDVFGPNFVGSAGRFASEITEPVIKPVKDHVNLDSVIPHFEDTPLGRASVETVRNTRETADKMDNLAGVVADLNQTLIAEVLPAWFKNVEDGQSSAQTAAEQAAKSLWWTKWAVIASVVVAMAATYWQVEVAKLLDEDSSKQQTRSEEILREQLKSQGAMLEQQRVTESLLREQIAQLKQIIAKQSATEGLTREHVLAHQRLTKQISHSQAAIVEAISNHHVESGAPTRSAR